MTLSKEEDLIEIRTLLIMNCKPQKIYEFRVENEFRGARDWKRTTIFDACKKIRAQQGSVERKQGSGRWRTVRTEENIDRVARLLQSPPRIPDTHLTARKVVRGTEISRSSVRIIAKERGLKVRGFVYLSSLLFKVIKKTKVYRIPKPKR